MAGNRISQVVVMDELDGTVDEFRQVFNIEDCLLFPYDERCDNPVRLVAGLGHHLLQRAPADELHHHQAAGRVAIEHLGD
ncbi:hypothetical protein KKE28_00200, partial [Patescibacteria group bacterium]|nr:hypothetical protein [Patescibacteria group bacterium]